MDAGQNASVFSVSDRRLSTSVHRHRHSRRRKRFHYHPTALGKGYCDELMADAGRRRLIAGKGLVSWALIVLFVGLPLAGLQFCIWLLGSKPVHTWINNHGPGVIKQLLR